MSINGSLGKLHPPGPQGRDDVAQQLRQPPGGGARCRRRPKARSSSGESTEGSSWERGTDQPLGTSPDAWEGPDQVMKCGTILTKNSQLLWQWEDLDFSLKKNRRPPLFTRSLLVLRINKLEKKTRKMKKKMEKQKANQQNPKNTKAK